MRAEPLGAPQHPHLVVIAALPAGRALFETREAFTVGGVRRVDGARASP